MYQESGDQDLYIHFTKIEQHPLTNPLKLQKTCQGVYLTLLEKLLVTRPHKQKWALILGRIKIKVSGNASTQLIFRVQLIKIEKFSI